MWRRVVFRWAFCYLVLYMLQPSPLDFLAPMVVAPYSGLWQEVVAAVAGVLGVDASVLPNASGDTTYNHVQVLCYAVLAAAVALAWSVASRRREHERLRDWLRAAMRIYVAIFMLLYGAAKVIKTQFPDPSLALLSLPVGDLSPNGLLWAFMGFSPLYTTFVGGLEMASGLLLVGRRTAIAGALLGVAVMGNVVVLNLGYDVVVKLFSLHLLAMLVVLAAPGLHRLFDLFVRNRAVAPVAIRPLLATPWRHRGLVAARTAGLLLLAALLLLRARHQQRLVRAEVARTPLYGVWVAEPATAPGAATGEGALRVIVDAGNRGAVQLADGQWRRVSWWPHGRGLELAEVSQWNAPPAPAKLQVRRLDGSRIELLGEAGGRTVLRRDEPEFRLVSGGFHWIREVPVM